MKLTILFTKHIKNIQTLQEKTLTTARCTSDTAHNMIIEINIENAIH